MLMHIQGANGGGRKHLFHFRGPTFPSPTAFMEVLSSLLSLYITQVALWNLEEFDKFDKFDKTLFFCICLNV